MTLDEFNDMPHGVKLIPPPPERAEKIMDAIQRHIDMIPEGKDAVAIGILNDQGANLAFVTRTKFDINVLMWVGKEWGGSHDYGIAVVKTIDF